MIIPDKMLADLAAIRPSTQGSEVMKAMAQELVIARGKLKGLASSETGRLAVDESKVALATKVRDLNAWREKVAQVLEDAREVSRLFHKVADGKTPSSVDTTPAFIALVKSIDDLDGRPR